MENTILLKSIKKFDKLLIVILVLQGVFLFASAYFKLFTLPAYVVGILGALYILMFVILIISIKSKSGIEDAYNHVHTNVANGDFEAIVNEEDNEFNIIAKQLVTELERKENDIAQIAKYIWGIENEEQVKITLKTKSNDVKYIFDTLKSIEHTKVATQLANNEFFKNIKTGKFNLIEVDETNPTERQLNQVLDTLYTMNVNLRTVHTALYEGNFKLELEEKNVDGDFLNVTNKFKTLLKAMEISTENLNIAIEKIADEDLLEFTSTAVKGNQVRTFKTIENLHTNLCIEIENIANAIAKNRNIDENEISSMFLPIIKALNNLKLLNNKLGSEEYTEYKEDYNRVSDNVIIESIENQLDELKTVMSFKDKEEKLVDNQEVEVIAEIDEKTETVIIEADDEVVDDKVEVVNIERDNEDDLVVNSENVEAEDLISLEEVSEEQVEDSIIENIEDETKELEEKNQVVEENNDKGIIEQSEIVKDSNSEAHKPNIVAREERKMTEGVGKKSNAKKQPLTYQQALASGSVEKHENKSNTTMKPQEDSTRTTREPLRSTREPERTAKEPARNTRESNRGSKEPMTYQQFLKRGDSDDSAKNKNVVDNTRATSNNNTNNTVQQRIGVTKNTLDSKPTSTRPSTSASSQRSTTASRNNSVANKIATTKLTKNERAELDLYGEFLDDKTRRDIDIITKGNDLGGF